jgi:hypothetical protein
MCAQALIYLAEANPGVLAILGCTEIQEASIASEV